MLLPLLWKKKIKLELELKKKYIRVFEQISQKINPLPSEFQLLMELGKYKILRLSVDTNYKLIQNDLGIKLINP